MYAGKVLVSDTAKGIMARRGTDTLEDAFIAYLEEAEPADNAPDIAKPALARGRPAIDPEPTHPAGSRFFSLRRMLSYSHREALELKRDPIRAALALIGSLVLMFVIGYGINMDVEDLSFAVLDRDDTTLSRDYIDAISGSRYFIEKPPLTSYAEIDRRLENGELSLALEIPPGFARDLSRGKTPEIGAWIDGAMPSRAEIVRGYVQGMHASWLTAQVRRVSGDAAITGDYTLEVRYRYNPDVRTIYAIVPAVIPLLLLIIPAMLTALSVVREKELGSIVNLYVTPATPLEFLLGKQLPYVVLAMLNFAILTLFSIFVFRVPFTGSLFAFSLGALFYVAATTGMGLLVSTFISSQIAAIFGTALFTLIPGAQYSGLIDPVSSLQGVGAVIGNIYPTTYFIVISRGTFSKALGLADLNGAFWPLIVAVPVILGLGAVLTRKQAR
jgi:ribosome-dependent ATPase